MKSITFREFFQNVFLSLQTPSLRPNSIVKMHTQIDSMMKNAPSSGGFSW